MQTSICHAWHVTICRVVRQYDFRRNKSSCIEDKFLCSCFLQKLALYFFCTARYNSNIVIKLLQKERNKVVHNRKVTTSHFTFYHFLMKPYLIKFVMDTAVYNALNMFTPENELQQIIFNASTKEKIVLWMTKKSILQHHVSNTE